MRLFVAFPPIPAWDGLQQRLRSEFTAEGIRWLHPEDLHLTLFFIGEVAEESTLLISTELSQLFSAERPFDLSPWKIATAGDAARPSMIWLRCHASDEFTRLHKRLHEFLFRFTARPDQHPHPVPHVTLARFPKGLLPSYEKILSADPTFGFTVDRAELWMSEKQQNQRRYTALEHFRFVNA